MRLPIPGFGLHEVAEYYKLPQSAEVRNGLHASVLFQQYCGSTDQDARLETKMKLIEYSRFDLEALVGIVHRIKQLARTPSGC